MSINEQVALWPAFRQAAAIRNGDFSSRELLELLVDRIERINRDLNAVVTLDLDTARELADAADRMLADGKVVGPLHGLPITIKDALETAGIQSTGGATELHNNVPSRDAAVVGALKDAGAIVFGKTNLPRWSGDIQSYNDVFGTTANPWNTERVPGGSSGGAATAVAAGFTAFEIGTDIGGSIRFPSSFCGVFGHKPSWGVVPATGYLDHEAGGTTEADVNVLGPIARSAEDLELLLGLVLRKEGPLVAALDPPPEDVKSLRVAAWLDDEFCPVDEKVLAVMTAAVDKLEAAGVAVDRSARPDLDPERALAVGMWLVTAAMAQSMPAEELEGAAVENALSGAAHREWLDMHAERESIRAVWADFFESYDAVLMPIGFVPPFPHDQEGTFGTRTLICNGEERPYADLVRWTILTGMAYLPASVPPLGLDVDGLPIGFQVVGRYGGDYTTIRLAGLIADLCGGYRPPPVG
ncbi:MAG: amidase family protein [Gammaproteobacteria bacterium]|nr:amidase family protein [Gammaproteobacteria bacterium]